MRNPGVQPPPATSPAPGAALVLARWNSWVRVYWPETGTTAWVDLAETAHEPLPPE